MDEAAAGRVASYFWKVHESSAALFVSVSCGGSRNNRLAGFAVQDGVNDLGVCGSLKLPLSDVSQPVAGNPTCGAAANVEVLILSRPRNRLH
jgi:hypothetical protein